MRINLSAIILTKNEEGNIIDCIESLGFCDEIIVVDDYSTDRTTDVLNNLVNPSQKAAFPRIKILKRKLDSDFADQRNFGLSKAKHEWVLFVDADERVSRELAHELKSQISKIKNKEMGFYVKRKDIMWGKELKYGETSSIKLLRFARKDAGKWQRKVHERWNIKGEIGLLRQPLYHYPHPTVVDFLHEINLYSSLRAHELHNRGMKTSLGDIILYPFGKFFLNYVIRLGFLDGVEGFIFATMMSFHSFLVRGKLHEYKKTL